jgi:uncharacterized membrane protein YfcA
MDILSNPLGLVALVFLIAALYGSVGHGGASGYLAVLSLTALDHQTLSTTALILNLIVAGLAFVTYWRAGHFSFRLTWPFLLTSIPFAFMGGLLKVSEPVYYILLATALILAALRMLLPLKDNESFTPPKPATAWGVGALIGLISGIVGVGGGIFLSPLMIISGWANVKQTSATAAFFIVANSLAGLGGRFIQHNLAVGDIWMLCIAGAIGGLAGAYYGARRAPKPILCRLLSSVLAIAALKLILKYH